jgi:outer membrane biogenesis lipoprotein LolB
MKSSFLFALGIVFSLLVSGGCVRPPVPPKLPPPAGQVDLNALRERSNHWRDYRATLRMRTESVSGKTRTRALVLFKGPQLARFESYTLMGQTAALFVRNETGASALIPSEKMVIVSQSPEALVEFFLGIGVPFEAFRYSLAGAIPLEQLERLQLYRDETVWRLSSGPEAGGLTFIWEYAPGMVALKAATVQGEGKGYRVEYDPPVAVSPESVPKKITLSSPDWRMEIQVDKMEPSPEVAPTVFYLPSLSDVRIVDLDKKK